MLFCDILKAETISAITLITLIQQETLSQKS